VKIEDANKASCGKGERCADETVALPRYIAKLDGIKPGVERGLSASRLWVAELQPGCGIFVRGVQFVAEFGGRGRSAGAAAERDGWMDVDDIVWFRSCQSGDC
jgi:hypothetical protein